MISPARTLGGVHRSNKASSTTGHVWSLQGSNSQVIDFGPLAAHVVGVTFTVSASASSGLPVSFRSPRGHRVCSVAGSLVDQPTGAADPRSPPYRTETPTTRLPGTRRSRSRSNEPSTSLRPQAITFTRPPTSTWRYGRRTSCRRRRRRGLPVSFHLSQPRCLLGGRLCATRAATSPQTRHVPANHPDTGRKHPLAPAPDQTRSFQGRFRPIAGNAGARRPPWPSLPPALRSCRRRRRAATARSRQRARRPPPRGGSGPFRIPRTHPARCACAVRRAPTVHGSVRIEPHPAPSVCGPLERAQR